jgi:hypothetical protein
MKQALTTIKSLVLRSALHHSISSRKAFAKHSFLLLLAGTVLLFSSCQKELDDVNSSLLGLLSSIQKKNKPKKTVPFKADFTVTTEVLQAAAPGKPLKFIATGTGTASHMGKTAFEALVTIDFETPTPPVTAIATWTLTAANGDKIFMDSEAPVGSGGTDANGNTVSILTNTITGGTGRFADASGTLTGSVTNGATSDAISLEGMISY